MSEQNPNDPAQQPWTPTGQQPGYDPAQPYPQQPYPPQPGYPQPGYPQPGYGYPPPEPPTTSRAVTALVLGIAGFLVCPGILSIPAWIIGRGAVKEIDASQGRLGGRSTAQAGYILGIIGTALAAIGLIVGIVFLALVVTVGSSVECTGSSDDNTTSFHCS